MTHRRSALPAPTLVTLLVAALATLVTLVAAPAAHAGSQTSATAVAGSLPAPAGGAAAIPRFPGVRSTAGRPHLVAPSAGSGPGGAHQTSHPTSHATADDASGRTVRSGWPASEQHGGPRHVPPPDDDPFAAPAPPAAGVHRLPLPAGIVPAGLAVAPASGRSPPVLDALRTQQTRPDHLQT